jgi:hypothetical protein
MTCTSVEGAQRACRRPMYFGTIKGSNPLCMLFYSSLTQTHRQTDRQTHTHTHTHIHTSHSLVASGRVTGLSQRPLDNTQTLQQIGSYSSPLQILHAGNCGAQVLNFAVFNNYESYKNSLSDFWRKNLNCLKQVYLIAPIFQVLNSLSL